MPRPRITILVTLLMFGNLAVMQQALMAATPGSGASRDEEAGKEEKLAALYLKLGKFDQCRTIVTDLLRRDPHRLNALLMLAKLEFQSGNMDQAEKAAAAALAIAPEDTDALLIKSNAMGAQGKTAEAAKLLEHVPADELARHRESLARSLNGGVQPPGPGSDDNSTGEEALDNALDAARKALEEKDLKTADRLTQDALKRWPNDRNATTLRADFLSQAGRPAEALTLLEKLKATQDPAAGPFTGQIDLAFALQDLGRREEAGKAFRAVLADSRYPENEQAQARKALAEQQNDNLLAEGQKALDRGDNGEAQRIDEQLQKSNPSSTDVQLFHAGVLKATGKASEAVKLMESIKAKNEPGKRFDSQLDYAAALAASHRYEAAKGAFREMMTSPALYTEEEREAARKGLRDLHDQNPAGTLAEVTAGRYDEGRLWRAKAQFFSHSFGNTSYQADVNWDEIELAKRLFPTDKNKSRTSATVGVTEKFSREWTGVFNVGGFDHGVMGSAMITHTSQGGQILSLRAAANDPARDTLLLEALDGRQHSLVASLESPLGKYFAIESSLIARQVEVDGHRIGDSFGSEAQFRWHPLTVSNDMYLAYAFEVKHFNGNESAFERDADHLFASSGPLPNASVYDAVPKNINRHSLQLHAGTQLTSNLKVGATAELVWRAEAHKWEEGVSTELLWNVSDNLDATARFEYSSGGAGPNTNGDVFLSTIGLRWYW